MSTTALILLIGGAVALLLVAVLVIMLLNSKNTKKFSKNISIKKEKVKEPEITFEELLSIVKSKRSSTNDLSKAVIHLVRYFPFPEKKGNAVSDEAKKYLDFVFSVASHPNANAKLIAFMDKELKRANPSYKVEIDVYEDRGLNLRRKKAA